MASIRVRDKQSLADIAVQYLGDSEAAYTLALLNGLSVSSVLTPGQVLQLPERIKNKKVVNYYNKRQLVPASGLNINNTPELPDGIGVWGIEIDFIIS